MIEIYASWVKGLPYDKEALGILKKSDIIDGIEMCNPGEEIGKIHDAGLKVSMHNPMRQYKISLEDKNFVDRLKNDKDVLDVCKRADAPIIGFHTGYAALFNDPPSMSNEEIKEKTIANIKDLENIVEKQVIFELGANQRKYLHQKNRLAADYVTSHKFVEDVLSKTYSGFLFDVSHTLVSSETHRLNNPGTSIDKNIDNILSISGSRIFQVHFNVPYGDDYEGFMDIHKIYEKGDKTSEKALDITKKVLSRSPHLKVFTLEMTTGLEPKEHAKILVDQAEYLISELGLNKK